MINKKIIVIGLMLLFIVFNVKGNEIANEYRKASPGFLDSSVNYYSHDVKKQNSIQDFFVNGKTCYAYKVFIWFDKDNPETLHTIASSISSDKIAGGTWVDGEWWCCEYSAVYNSNIWKIDHISGDMTLIGESGVGLHGLAYDDTTDTMYACGVADLFTISMATGIATPVGSFGISGSVMIGIACDGYGNMYTEDLHTDSFYSVDPMTGTATLIGPFGLDLNYGQDMAFDKEEGICYLSAFTVHAGNEGALYTCNLSTGAATKIGNFGSVPTQITGFVIPYVLNYPPDTPIITGPMSGKVGTEYEYSFVSVNPDEDNNSYYIEWGDGSSTDWTTFLPSGVPYFENHTWTQKGTYKIRAKAKDIHGDISDWGELTVIMPRDKVTSNFLFMRLLEQFPSTFPILRYILRLYWV
jgi:hypothetical protein